MTVPMYDPPCTDQALSVIESPQGAAADPIRAALTAGISDSAFRVYAATLHLVDSPLTYVTERRLAALLGVPPARVRHSLGELTRAGLLVRRQRSLNGRVRSTYEVSA